MAELEEVYKRLVERQRDVQERLTELGSLAERIVTAQHQFRRVELEQYEDLSQALEAAWDDFGTARERFGRLLREGI